MPHVKISPPAKAKKTKAFMNNLLPHTLKHATPDSRLSDFQEMGDWREVILVL